MPALAPALVLALAVKYGGAIAPRQIEAQATIESGRDPLAIHDDVTGRVYHPVNLVQALRIAMHCEMQGHDIDVGLLQINSGNFPWLHLSLAEAFDPIQSIRAGVRVLTALSRYNTGSPVQGFTNGYVQRVTSIRGASRSDGNDAVPRDAPGERPPYPAHDSHNDLIDALIQPGASRSDAAPLHRARAASPESADRLPRSQGNMDHVRLIDPLIHLRELQPATERKEASDG